MYQAANQEKQEIMLPKVDFHIHTIYSGHSYPDMNVGNIIRKAEELKFLKIVILEHIPPIVKNEDGSYTIGDCSREPLDMIKRDLEGIKTNIEVYLGTEVDIDRYKLDGSLLFEDLEGIDFIMASMHCYPGTDIFWFTDYQLTNYQKEKLYITWFECMKKVVRNPLVNIWAHPAALIARQNIFNSFSGRIMKDFEELLNIMKENNVAFELNENMPLRLSLEQSDTYFKLVRLAKEKEVKISLGSDAHYLDGIGRQNWCGKVAKQAQLKRNDFSILEKGE